ncbi:MAG: hypothetical protein L6R41_007083 [Letrouitia leprolyta]|nr:MAG: hypothetical protein L6R41_007083 [Letrouitia leprolyta]
MDRRLNLFLASRQLHAEASEIFFAKNVFQLESHVAEKTPGREPFCPTLSRVQRCVLNLRLTSPLDCTFILSYLSSFIDVLTPKHKLKHLLIVATPDQVECLHPLERLSRVELAQIDVASPFYPYWCSGSPSMGFKMYLAYYKPKAVYQQHLERIMMCDGSEAQKEKIKERLKGEYVSEPELTVALQGEELEKAKMEGGWKGAGEMMFVLHEVLEGMDKILC